MYSIWASTDLSDIILNDFFSYLKFQRGNRFYQLSHQPQCKLQLLFLHLDVSCTHLPPYQFKIDTTASRAKSISKTAIFMFLMRVTKDYLILHAYHSIISPFIFIRYLFLCRKKCMPKHTDALQFETT